MTPTTELAQRIASLFNRRVNTNWSEKEVKRYRQLVKDKCLTGIDDMELIERYYVYQRRKGALGIHRRDLYTFLNNFPGELDRARAWDDEKRERATYKSTIKIGNNPEIPVTDDDFKRISDLARSELAKFKEKLKNPQIGVA